jgi:hypothetical protein
MLARGLVVAAVVVSMGCIKTPDISVDASGWGRRDRVDTTRTPPTSDHEEAKAELRKAYAEIEHLRKENSKLKGKVKELEAKLDD